MVNNTKEKSLTVIKEKNIFTKVINFFRGLFNKNKKNILDNEQYNYNNQIIQKQSFLAPSDIEIKFEEFRQGNIKESDLTQNEKQQMIKIFQERIQKENQEIDYLKTQIIKIRAQYLRTN